MGNSRRQVVWVEERSGRAESGVSVEVVRAAMKLIAAGLQDDVDDSASVASAFGGGLSLGAEFVDGIKRHDDAGDAGDAALVHGWNVVPEIVVVDTVNLPVHLVGAGAVERTEAADGVPTVARLNGGKLGEVAPVHGYVLNRFGSKSIVL